MTIVPSNHVLAAWLVAAAVMLPAGPALAQELNEEQLNSLFLGRTAYIEFAANPATGAGEGAIFYGPDGSVSGRLPNGQRRAGTRVVKGNTACLTWQGQPEVCSRLVQDGERIRIIGVDGRGRGIIVRIADGNPENL